MASSTPGWTCGPGWVPAEMARACAFGVMATPALVVDGEVKVSGRVPTVESLEPLLG